MFSNRTSPFLPRRARKPPTGWVGVVCALLVATAARAGESPVSSTATINDGKGLSQPASVSVDALVKSVGQRKLWPLKPDVAEDRLQALGPWKREQPIPDALTLVAGRAGVVERSELSYSADAKKRWIFLGASFFLGDTDLERLYHTLSEQLQLQLGKPAWVRKGKKSTGGKPAAGWRLGNRLELLLTHSPVEGEHLLAIMVSEPQGGPSD